MIKNTVFLLLAILCIASCRAPKDLVYQNVQNFKIGKIGLQKTALSMDIRLYNPNQYAIKLKKADIDVFLNGTLLGKMKVDGKFTICGLDTLVLPVMLDADMKNVLPSAFQLLLNSDINVKLTGTVKAGHHGVCVRVPINYEGKQDILSGVKW